MSDDPAVTATDQFRFEDSLLRSLREAAAAVPDREFIRIAGERFTFADALGHTEAVAKGLLELGLEAGDRVGLMAGNVPAAIWAWLGANAAQLIDVPFNAQARGRMLGYFVEDAEPRVLVGTEQYLEILAETLGTDPEIVVCTNSAARPFGDGVRHLTFDELLKLGSESGRTLTEPTVDETATIMFTSGTTGPSKGVMLSQRYYPAVGALYSWSAGMRADDVFYSAQPLFHIDSRTYLVGSLHNRTTVAFGGRFSVSRFWDEVREHDATLFGFIGTMLWLLYKQPARDEDSQHRARLATCSSLPYEIQSEFETRFGIEIYEGYGMTESVMITVTPPGKGLPHRVGAPAPHLSVAVLDGNDDRVPNGEIGEICFRPNWSHTTMQGYWRKPAETLEAWRNLWFHTGDLGRLHDDGQFEYVGRKKDAIRRRGENVSAWEVEQAVCAHPDVLEAAAIGVPSELGEEDVAVILVPVPGRSPDPVELVGFLERDLPNFAVPRYIEFVDEFPKTPSERIVKGKVRERGITAAAWDANAELKRR